jgi:lysophospholipase L1-like esterase
MPSLVADRAGVDDFQMPLVSEPGIPPQLELKALSPVTVAPKSGEYGLPLNLTLSRPYDNLAVPGATLRDCLTKSSDGAGMHTLVLRGLGTQVEQAVALQPDLLLVWIGNNDALNAVLTGTAVERVTLTPKEQFHADYAQLLGGLAGATTADIVVGNIPDCAAIPFASTIPPYIINPATGAPVIGDDGMPMTYLGQSDDGSPFIGPQALVLLTALEYLHQGYGVPLQLGGRGQPLPDHVVLTPGESATIRDYTAAYNASIAALAAGRSIPVVDMSAELTAIREHGLHYAGIEITGDFLSGGFFSYDGVHPNAFGYAYGANLFIEAANAAYGARLPLVPLHPFLSGTSPHGEGGGVGALVLEDWEYWMKLFMPERWVIKSGALR